MKKTGITGLALVWLAAALQCSTAWAGYREGMDALAVKDYVRARVEFESEPENGPSVYQLGRMATQGWGEPRNLERAAGLIGRAAALGHPEAKISQVFILGNGTGVPKDTARAVALLEEQVAGGSLEAQVLLGKALRYGWWNQAKDDPRATELFQKAANQGSEEARYQLALALMAGQGIAKDEARGADLLRQGAERKYAQSQVEFARLLTFGLGVPKDEVAGTALYRQVAENGDEYAQYGLGMAYLNGRGIAKDEAEAARWLDASARQGWSWAQLQMGHLFRNGTGVPRMRTEAFKWYTLAARSNSSVADLANTRRTDMSREMSPQEISDATRKAEQFRPVPGFRPRLTALPAVARYDKVVIGDKTLSVPLPKGFANSWQIVEAMQRAFPNDPDLRPLLLVMTREDDLNRLKLGLLTTPMRSIEFSKHVPDDTMVVTPELFVDIKKQLRDQLDTGVRNGRYFSQGVAADETRAFAFMRSGVSEPDRLDAIGLLLVKDRVMAFALTGFRLEQKTEMQELLKTVTSEVVSANKGFFER